MPGPVKGLKTPFRDLEAGELARSARRRAGGQGTSKPGPAEFWWFQKLARCTSTGRFLEGEPPRKIAKPESVLNRPSSPTNFAKNPYVETA